MYFLTLAKKGRTPGASGGEKRAARLAKSLRGMIDDLAGLDSKSVRGFCNLVHASGNGQASTVEQLLK